MTESLASRTEIKGLRWREPSGRTHAVNRAEVRTVRPGMTMNTLRLKYLFHFG